MKWGAVLILLVLSTVTQAQTYTIETIPNPKEESNSYVSDPSHILSESTVTFLNNLLSRLEKETTAQVAVVVVPSIGYYEITDFSQRLFQKWGIGQREKDNGLLVLLVKDQRTVRFHTGYGLEGTLTDVRCKNIQRERMVPSFEKGNYDQGMMEGMSAVSEILTNPENVAEIYDNSGRTKKLLSIAIIVVSWMYGLLLIIVFVEAWRAKKFKRSPEAPRLTIPLGWWLFVYVVVPAAFFLYHNTLFISPLQFLFRFYVLLSLFHVERFVRVLWLAHPFVKQGRQHELYNYIQLQKPAGKFSAFLFPIPSLPFYFILMAKAKKYRYKPKHCKRCGVPMKLLSEQEEDSDLNAGQQAEEKIKSVDYDVWKCGACGGTEIFNYNNASTAYTACQQCSYVTSSVAEKRIITPATTDTSGAGEEEYVCTYCGHRHIVAFVISRLSDSSSSSSSSGSSSSSFGGGSSGGGGASSSW